MGQVKKKKKAKKKKKSGKKKKNFPFCLFIFSDWPEVSKRARSDWSVFNFTFFFLDGSMTAIDQSGSTGRADLSHEMRRAEIMATIRGSGKNGENSRNLFSQLSARPKKQHNVKRGGQLFYCCSVVLRMSESPGSVIERQETR